MDIVCTTLDGNVIFYANDGTGTLINSNYLTYPGTHLRYMYMSGVSDFNGDGFPDIAVAGTTTDTSVHEFQPLLHPGSGGGQWIIQKHNHYTGELAGMAIADFNADGINDVLLALNDVVSGVQLWSGDGVGKFVQGGLQVWTDEILSISSYDYNKDGVLDVVLGTSGTSTQEIDVILNNGAGIFDTVNPFSADIAVPASAVSFAFLDQDADIDVVSAGNTAGSLFSFVQLPTNELNQTVNSPFLSGGTAVLLRVGEIGN